MTSRVLNHPALQQTTQQLLLLQHRCCCCCVVCCCGYTLTAAGERLQQQGFLQTSRGTWQLPAPQGSQVAAQVYRQQQAHEPLGFGVETPDTATEASRSLQHRCCSLGFRVKELE